jgi:hypothetical protein
VDRPETRHAQIDDPSATMYQAPRESGSGVAARAAREQELKGVPDPWRLYRVVT